MNNFYVREIIRRNINCFSFFYSKNIPTHFWQCPKGSVKSKYLIHFAFLYNYFRKGNSLANPGTTSSQYWLAIKKSSSWQSVFFYAKYCAAH